MAYPVARIHGDPIHSMGRDAGLRVPRGDEMGEHVKSIWAGWMP